MGLFLAPESLCVLVTQMSGTVGHEGVVVGGLGELGLEKTHLGKFSLSEVRVGFCLSGVSQVQVSVL